MVQLLSQVYTEPLKILNTTTLNLSSKISWMKKFSKPAIPSTLVMQTGKRKGCNSRTRVASEDSVSSTDTTADDDYYAVLGLLPDATPKQIKKAYYECMKACHPDLSGNDPQTTNFCIFINEVYAVLSDPNQRNVYDEIHGYSVTSTNPFMDDSISKDHVFVDEFNCIGTSLTHTILASMFLLVPNVIYETLTQTQTLAMILTRQR